MLKRVEFQCGLAYGTLSDPQNVDKTAEEIRSSKQRSYTTVKDLQRALGNALTDLVYSISKLLDAQWNSGTAVSPPGDCNVTFDFDDSIISDPKERKQMYWGYVTAASSRSGGIWWSLRATARTMPRPLPPKRMPRTAALKPSPSGVPDAAAVLPRPDAGCLCAALAAGRG